MWCVRASVRPCAHSLVRACTCAPVPVRRYLRACACLCGRPRLRSCVCSRASAVMCANSGMHAC
eukprot:3709511-Pleurochrysis_carterae.AAC.1